MKAKYKFRLFAAAAGIGVPLAMIVVKLIMLYPAYGWQIGCAGFVINLVALLFVFKRILVKIS